MPQAGQADGIVAAGVVAVDVEDLDGIAEFGVVAVRSGSGSWISWNQRAKAFSLSLMPGVMAAATISSRVRKLLRPLESQGLTTSVSPTFSMRTARLDSQVCSKPLAGHAAPHRRAAVLAIHRAALNDRVWSAAAEVMFLHVALGHVGRMGVGRPGLQTPGHRLPSTPPSRTRLSEADT